ncbi:MAG: hypothetical protein KDA41_00330, partial [Planctomycetales bacterium]|nr:hypothetical protein [Planctomycetales bacterium]
MNAPVPSLNIIDVASPCPADWQEMTGDDRVRFCGECQMHVYNLSALSETEALRLVNRHEGRLCVRFFRRQDGTVLTNNCPVGLAAWRRKIVRMWASTAAMFGAVAFGSWMGRAARGQEGPKLERLVPAEALAEVKGQVCAVGPWLVQPTLSAALNQLTAEQLKPYLLMALDRESQLSGGMPDPEKPAPLPEKVRQVWEAKARDKTYAPRPGTPEFAGL